MADFFRGLSGGFQSGLQLGQAMRDKQQREELAQVYAKPDSYLDYTAAGQKQIQDLAASGLYNLEAVPGAEGVAPTLRYTPKQGLMSYDASGNGVTEAPIEIAPQQVQRYAGRVAEGQFDPMALQGLRAREAARVVGAYGDPVRAAQLEADALRMEREAVEAPLRQQSLRQQVELGGIQVGQARTAQEKTTGFDAAFAKINDTKYDKPEEKDAAVLAAVAQFRGPEAAAALQANYSTNERNKLLNDGTRFDQIIRQARLKGPAAALKAIDELNDSFTLEIDGFKVTQVNKDGTRVPFLEAKSADEFALSVDSRIKEGGAFELAKFRLDEDTKKAQVGYYNAMAKKASQEGAANQLSGVQLGYSRDEKGNPVQVMSALRFNKKSGDLESVQIPLERNIVPAAALDPKKINDAAEQLVGTPVDPTNKKGPQHTFQTARQAVTDQIFNQYLGTGGAPANLDPAALAKQILANEKPSAPAAAAPAAAKTSTNLGLDPNRPKTNVSSVTGVTRETPPTAPNLVAAVGQGLDAGQARYKAYLESKIASKQPLTADEEIRAKRFGLK